MMEQSQREAGEGMILTGFVDHIIYENKENGYTVFILVPEEEEASAAWEGEEEICVVGKLPGITAGESVRVRGEFVDHETYGRQFSGASFEQVPAQSRQAMIRYLGSGAIKGIGKKLAERIVKRFGKDTFRIIEEEPERLAEVTGISRRKAMEVADQMIDRRAQRAVLIYLDSLGFSTNMALRIFAEYGGETKARIQENPYRLANDIEGVGFATADDIARRLGFAVDAEFRVDSGLLFVLRECSGQGHTYLPQGELLVRGRELLSVSENDIEESLMRLYMAGRIVRKAGDIYLAHLYKAEANSATLLEKLNEPFPISVESVSRIIDDIESEESYGLDEIQRRAIIAAAQNGVSVLTGGPGTGKTTTVSTMIRYFESQGMDIFLAAPTGRAAKRMSEATGRDARTIHRLLEVSAVIDGGKAGRGMFTRNEDNPLECDVLIVDEMSMVDILLLHSLLRAVPEGCRLIFVGDTNQLPSVGPGNVLGDIIGSGHFSVVELKKIFRQAGQSDIVLHAHRINDGRRFVLDNKSRDFFMARCRDADTIIAAMLKYLLGKLPAYVGAQRLEIQILTPTRKGNLGVERLNAILQKNLNPESPSKAQREFGERIFREGDKVMQTKNNYQLEWNVLGRHGIVTDSGSGVFNGDMGIITEISDYDQKLMVRFDDGRVAAYDFNQAAELEHAYAITIHKSQGSEYPAVLIPLLAGPRMLMNRNLIYTAITRAKKCVCLVGDENVLWSMVDNVGEAKRYSGLARRIRDLDIPE